jgi:hypothetical protein
MKNMAQVDQNNIVINITVAQDDWTSEGFIEYTASNPASIGFTYDPINKAFIAPQPYPSWSLDSNFNWQAPKPLPSEGYWIWNEDLGDWVEYEA